MKLIVVTLAIVSSVACGTIGSPIPPEDVGITPTIERQKRIDAMEAEKREAAESEIVVEPQGQDVNLPDLRPVGTR
ncbi:MAG TPA: hypothetical protein VJL88_10750 [Nitrospira sp.]|nr:hypothetical protein [Nitrospira sp.]